MGTEEIRAYKLKINQNISKEKVFTCKLMALCKRNYHCWECSVNKYKMSAN